MDKEYKVLGTSFVKFTNPTTNTWQVTRIVDLSAAQLQTIVDGVGDKVVFVYDRHNPKDTREIVGEVSNIKYDDGVVVAIKWNDYGKEILTDESRYPSVELSVTDDDNYKLLAIAMVGEPASSDVDILELNIQEEHKKMTLKKLIAAAGNKETLKQQLLDSAIDDPKKAYAALVDSIMDAIDETDFVATDGEVEELDESEEERHLDEGAGYREADRKDEDVHKKEDEAERHEDEGTGLRDYFEDRKNEELAKEECSAVEELTALAYEYGVRYDKGTPTALSLSEAVKIFKELLPIKSMAAQRKKEIAFSELKFIKPAAKQSEELSAIDNAPGKKAPAEITAAEQFGNAMRQLTGL